MTQAPTKASAPQYGRSVLQEVQSLQLIYRPTKAQAPQNGVLHSTTVVMEENDDPRTKTSSALENCR